MIRKQEGQQQQQTLCCTHAMFRVQIAHNENKGGENKSKNETMGCPSLLSYLYIYFKHSLGAKCEIQSKKKKKFERNKE